MPCHRPERPLRLLRPFRLLLLIALLAFLPVQGWAAAGAHGRRRRAGGAGRPGGHRRGRIRTAGAATALPAPNAFIETAATAAAAGDADLPGPFDGKDNNTERAQAGADPVEQWLPPTLPRLAALPARTGAPRYTGARLSDPDLPRQPRLRAPDPRRGHVRAPSVSSACRTSVRCAFAAWPHSSVVPCVIHNMKRILLFLATNLAVMLVLSLTASLLGVNRFLTANGLNLGMLLAFAALMGFGGAFISLLMSKPIAKWSTGAQVITTLAPAANCGWCRRWRSWPPAPACRCPRSPSTRASPTPSPPAPPGTARWWQCRPACWSRCARMRWRPCWRTRSPTSPTATWSR